MKRLLAYLFIVFGLGLTFSANSKADNYCIPKQAEKDYFNTIYIFNKCYIYHKKVDLNTFVEFALTHPLNSVGTQKGSPFIVEENLKWLKKYLRENNISKSKINKSIKRVKIVKKELGKTQKVAKEKSENLYVERMLTKKEKLDFAKGKIKIYKCSTSTGTHLQMDDCIGDYYKKKLLPNKGLVNFYLLRDYTKTQIAKAEPSQTQKVNIANCREVNALSGKVRFLKNNEAPIVYKNINIDFLNKRIEFEKNKDWVKFNNTNEKIYKTNFKHGSEDNIILTHVVAMHAGTSLLIKINYDLGIVEQGQYQQMKLICEKINNTKTQFAKLFDSKSLNIEKTQIAKVEPSQTQKTVSNKYIDTNEWFRWVESYPSALKNGTRLSQSKNKGISIIQKINLDSKVYVPDSVNEHFKYFNVVREQTNYEKYKGNKYKVLAAARNYFAGLMLAAGYHEDLKTAAILALKNCKKQEDGTYPLTECVIVMIGDDKVTYKEQGYWSEVLLKKPTLIKKYYDTIDKNSFDQNYLAKNFLNDQKVKFNISNTRIVKNNSQEEFKPKKTNQDNEAPVIEIAEVITVDSQAYTLKGKVKDKSQIYLTIDGRQVDVKKGKFELDRFSINSDATEEIKIVAIDKWNNRSEKIVKVTIDLQSTTVAKVYEQLKPNNIKVKTDNNKIAIIIGIEKYENLTNLDAKYANRDAQAFRTYATRALGIKPSNIKMLIDEKATRSQALKAFKLWLPKIAGKGGKDIHIFFAGHGLASDNGEDLYILPQDGESSLLEDTAISRVELISLINKVNPRSVTMFFDTCYSGQTRDERMLVASLRPIRIVADEQDTPDNFTIFTASNYDQTSGSIEEAKHGMFSYYLMKGLEGNADNNKDKKITNGELIAYLKSNVSEEAFTQNREQDPMLAGDPDKILMSYR
jgi:hypothetical protein